MAEVQNPELEVVRFAAEDVIATSGGATSSGVTLSGFGTGTKNDNTFTVGNQTFTNTSGEEYVPDNLSNALKNAGGIDDHGDIWFYGDDYAETHIPQTTTYKQQGTLPQQSAVFL